MSNPEEELRAWEQLNSAHINHVGHNDGYNSAGMGSPITRIVLEHRIQQFDEIFRKVHPEIKKDTSE